MTEVADVRLANPDDIDQLCELCRLLHQENAMLPTDDYLVKELLYAFTAHEPTPSCLNPGMAGVIEMDGQLVAMIALRVNQMWYSRQPYIEELFNFVHPDYRRSDYARLLVNYAKAMADDLGLPLLMGIVSNTRTEAKVRLYERLLPFSGAFFVYRGDLHKQEAAA